MSDRLQFFIPCIPPKTTAQAALRIMKRANGQQFVGKYDTSKGKQVQGELIALLRPHAPADRAFEVTHRCVRFDVHFGQAV